MARRRQAITIRHVAAEAGVSLQTVSRVINNGPNVREAVALRVREAIASLGYVPSIAAQRMGGSRSYLILALNDRDRTIADWQVRQGTDWVDQMLLGGMLKCAEHGYRMIFELVDTHSDHVEREIMAALAALQPDGVILTPPHSENPLITGLLAAQDIAFARIGSLEPGPGFALSMHDEGAAAIATRHLIELGHRRVGFISGSPDYAISGARVAGWQNSMAEAGLPSDALLADGDFGFASGISAARRLLESACPPTAIIASSDQMALATLEVARSLGIMVPADLSLISFDNTPIVRFTDPPLTAIDQPIAEVTSRAVALIIEAAGGGLRPTGSTIVPATLVERGSTQAPTGVTPASAKPASVTPASPEPAGVTPASAETAGFSPA